jgi:hypothetical protein
MHPEQKKTFLAMTPEKKLQVALGLYYSAKEIKVAGLKRQHPEWSMEKINQKAREIFLYART